MFWKLLAQAAKSIIENRNALAKALSVPFLIFCTIYSIEFFLPNTWYSFFAEWLAYVVDAIFAIITHRIVLLGPNAVPKWGLIKWTKRETWFVFYLLALFAITWGLFGSAMYLLNNIFGNSAGIGLLGIIFAVILVVLSVYFSARLALVFPSTAIDQRINFKSSWNLTDNHEGLMVLIVILVPVFFVIPSLLSLYFFLPVIYVILPDPTNLSDLSIINLFTQILGLGFTVFIIAALSVTYRYIMDEKEKSPETQMVG